MLLSIIFVNWNSTAYIRDSIASVYRWAGGVPVELIVVDNASPTRDVDVLKQEFPEILLVKSEANLGFAGANNLGFEHSTGEYVMFLNPDTKLIECSIPVLLRHLEALPDAGILGCRLLNEDLSVQTSCIQTFPTILNQALDADYLRERWPQSSLFGIGPLYSAGDRPAPVEVISGACMTMRREAFEKAGRFSEEYFMYAEDLDLCYKMRLAGFQNYYTGETSIVHFGGKSSAPESATIMKWRAILRYCRKHYGGGFNPCLPAVVGRGGGGGGGIVQPAQSGWQTYAAIRSPLFDVHQVESHLAYAVAAPSAGLECRRSRLGRSTVC
jgi:GT2 family glycosyltransferase